MPVNWTTWIGYIPRDIKLPLECFRSFVRFQFRCAQFAYQFIHVSISHMVSNRFKTTKAYNENSHKYTDPIKISILCYFLFVLSHSSPIHHSNHINLYARFSRATQTLILTIRLHTEHVRNECEIEYQLYVCLMPGSHLISKPYAMNIIHTSHNHIHLFSICLGSLRSILLLLRISN